MRRRLSTAWIELSTCTPVTAHINAGTELHSATRAFFPKYCSLLSTFGGTAIAFTLADDDDGSELRLPHRQPSLKSTTHVQKEYSTTQVAQIKKAACL